MPDEPTKSTEDIKVTDRRSFTSEGSRRRPSDPAEAAQTPATQVPPRSQILTDPTEPSAPGSGEDPGGIDFGGFIEYLGQIAIQQMLSPADPSTENSGEPLAAAYQTIEILSMLKQKTEGNLTPRESRSLDQLLYHLKLEYARRAAPTGQ